jgi:hypothetical protein
MDEVQKLVLNIMPVSGCNGTFYSYLIIKLNYIVTSSQMSHSSVMILVTSGIIKCSLTLGAYDLAQVIVFSGALAQLKCNTHI